MRSVRIEPDLVYDGAYYSIDVICDCGANNLRDETTGERSFKHYTQIAGLDKNLVCDCGEKYQIHPQQTHIHVSQLGK